MKQLKDNLYNDLVGIISSVTRIDSKQITKDTLILEELGIDSLMGIEILARIEKKFKLNIDEKSLLKISKIGEFLDLVKLKIGKSKK